MHPRLSRGIVSFDGTLERLARLWSSFWIFNSALRLYAANADGSVWFSPEQINCLRSRVACVKCINALDDVVPLRNRPFVLAYDGHTGQDAAQ